MTGETVLVDGDLDVRIRLAASRMADGDFAVGLASGFKFFSNSAPATSARGCRDDVAGMVCVTGESIRIDRDLYIRIGVTARGMADGDAFSVSNHLLFNVLGHLFGAAT